MTPSVNQEANTDALKQPSSSATTKTLEEILKELVANSYETRFGTTGVDDTDFNNALAAINNYTTQRVIEELENFEPFFKGNHNNCPDPKTCIGYMNAQSDFDNEKELRLAELKGGIDG